MTWTHALAAACLLSGGLDAPLDARYPEAATVFHCAFDQSCDENFDDWPDEWSRRRGHGFPHYVEIKISDDPAPAGGRCLRVELDGGGAVAYSPPIKIGPLFTYVLEGLVKTRGLSADRAFFSITLFDGERHRLESFTSKKVCVTDGWEKIRLGPVASAGDSARFAVIGLHVEPESGEDLRGTAWFDDVWLGRSSRMAVRTGDPINLFTDPEAVEVFCEISGFTVNQPQVTLVLEDALGRELARDRRALAVQSSLDTAEVSLDGLADVQVGMTGQLRWRPPISGPGFYRVRVEMEGRETVCQREQLSLAVIEPSNAPAAGEFGWSLPDGDKPVPLGELSRLVGQAGIRWLKYPLWYDDAQSDAAAEQLVTFSERVHAYGIELIGLLHKPPGAIRDRYGRQGALRAAELFAPDPEVWYPSLEPVMSRLATRVRWWQLGRDEDGSFADYRNPAIKVAQVKRELDRIGQNVNLGIGWHWIDALPGAGAAQAPWRFLTLSADPPMTHEELAEYLDAAAGARVGRWVVVEPLSRSHYPTAVRADDLVRRMLAANIHGADAVFCPDPFDAEHGLMNPDGTPGELFLPWRTTALALAGATYLGSIQLPSGSPNFIFARHDDALMVVWNERPTEEVLYLGDKVRQIDLWGQAATPEKRGHRQVIEVGPLPSFVTGLSEPVARWRMQFEFARQRLPSVFGRAHADSFSLKNTFVGGTGGRATLVMPERWQVSPPEVDFRLSAGEPLTQPLQILLPYSASSGRHPVRVDFDLQADRRYQFSVYRHIDVGMGDVYLELATRLNEQGELEVEQRMVNEGDGRVNFRCQLYAPERRRQKTDVLGLGPGRAVHVYRIPDGQELLGKTLWLRAEEIEGPRILNYRFPARP